MTGIMNREFAELAQNGLNYLTWASDVQIVLEGKEIKDKEKIDKNLTTFHPTAIQSSRNYRQEKFEQYAALIDALQVDEAQDEDIKKNFYSQPFAGGPSQEVNAGAYKVRKPIMKKRSKKGKKGPNPPTQPSTIRSGRGRQGPRIVSVADPRVTSPDSVGPLNTLWTRTRTRRRARCTLYRWRQTTAPPVMIPVPNAAPG
ncbi:hypothetical protein QYE76_064059 [Lolium multiflorum]|uniref:Uncharacterized protein n=1 Tax=Lolium multiflorum TaxID=4521 RepID=A0AAD8S6S5_LOLMU|nr:hypothetical protein QYE76_064059 [Lolium multiflorum]